MVDLTEQFVPTNGKRPLSRACHHQYMKGTHAMADSHYMPPDQESQDSSNGIEDHPLFTQMSAFRDKIADIESQMAALKVQISAVKDEANQIAYDEMITSVTMTERLRLATQLYWLYDDLIRAQTIGNVLGTYGQNVASRIGKAVIHLRCVDCGETVEYFPTSRSDAKYRASSGTCVCDQCTQERQTGHQRRAELFNQQVAFLRAMPYSEYLKTDHWQNLRIRMLKRAGFKCQVCNQQGQLHVHHRTYKNRGNEDLKDLIVLCADCHQEFHDKMELAQ